VPANPRTNNHKEAIMKARTLIPALLITFAATGCATWDNMSSREKSAATGAAVGGVAGAVVTDGGILGTVGGAAIGGVIGDQLGKKK
jgi:osmotically inducible lipoprotein OsmB